ncbi:hypothetical protein [Chryseobacterium jejuense]|uniref:hypothetical protein n=1 Tax=Chryseobacterium jejuense TaxID=445960 RepID=UPI001AE817BE|nr:hypothetical protein [Chryseobacterium jejuense]MBP2614946.1 hypothetical protein [Chryseobacterium jejuense]
MAPTVFSWRHLAFCDLDSGPFSFVNGNISNSTNSANAPLGYFRLSEEDTKDYTIQ